MVLEEVQTYIGVLATFVVLCLFSVRNSSNRNETSVNREDYSNSGERDDESNFIYALIRQVGRESLGIIKREIDSFKKKFDGCYNEVGLDGKTRLQNAIERAQREHPQRGYEQSLMKALTRYKSAISAFSNKASDRITLFENAQRMGLKDELTLVALMNLVFVVVVMMVDALSFIPECWQSLWMNLLIAYSTPFQIYLFVRFCRKSPDLSAGLGQNTVTKWSGCKIFMLAASPIVIWLLFSCFICTPSFAVLLLIPVLSVFYFAAGRLSRQLEDGAGFNRGFILRISSFFIFLSAILCLVFALFRSGSLLYEWGETAGVSSFIDNANNAVQLLLSPNIAKYSVVVFFSFNVFFLPLVLGYWYIQKTTDDLEREIRDMFMLSVGEIEEANASFDKLILEMDSSIEEGQQ